MERFKICEKETKTKAFSKEGLGQQPKTVRISLLFLSVKHFGWFYILLKTLFDSRATDCVSFMSNRTQKRKQSQRQGIG